MNISHLKASAARAALITFCLSALLIVADPARALIKPSDGQRETITEMIDQLQARHYSKRSYDNTMSSQHLDSYLDSLDRARMFLTAADIVDFEQYRTAMDEQLRQGDLTAGFAIFNRFQQRLEDRLQKLLDTLPEMVAAMDFTVDESYSLEVEGRPWAATEQALDERWRKQIKNQVLGLKLADKAGDEIVPTLEKRYKNQLQRVQQYNNQDVFQIYANALAELYDPHTNYFSPRRSENFNINMSLSLEGIGAVLQSEDEYTKVTRLVAKGPADKQGELHPSDRIVGVGQGEKGEIEDVIGWRLDEVVDLIRGPKGSLVRLEVLPAKSKTSDQRNVITIERNQVKLEEQSAQKEIIEVPTEQGQVKVGVIDIPTFYIDFDAMRRGEKDYKSTTRDVRKLLEELQQEDVDGIVIDLRNDGGGSLQEANDLTGLFIEYGPTVQIRHSSHRVWRDGKRLKSNYYDGPLVVLVNRLSASASEIFAGAIQDYHRGLIVGDRSFGKGTVQTLIPLTEGQLKVTESKFYRISGDSTQHRGVLPDVEFPTIYDAEEIGESALDHALPWDQINPVRHRLYNDMSALLPLVKSHFQQRSEHNPDFSYLEDQIALAQATRKIKTLPLQEKARIALRDEQEAKALAIENKRRAAKGEDLLTSLDDDEDSEEDPANPGTTDATDAGKKPGEDDVLLQAASGVLADVVRLGERRVALHQAETD